jgi:glutamate--cysteine ligase
MLTIEEMGNCFAPVMKPYKPRVGFEYEVFCLDGETLSPLPFEAKEGKRGLRRVLETANRIGKGTLLGEPHTKASLPGDALLSLEPGGQFEFSSAPKERFQSAIDQFHRFMLLLEQLRSIENVHFFFGGVNPVHTIDEIGLVTGTPRYRIMDEYFPTVGALGRRMMRQTCSIQVSFDYGDTSQGHKLLRTAQYIAPFAAALFANAPFVDGKKSGYLSYRGPIWADTDPSRCGMLPGFTRPDYGFGDYIRHVVQAPMFFVQMGEEYVPARGMTFAEFNERGFQGQKASLSDFSLHNSTIFTDVRLKHTVEVRTVDCQDPALFPAVLAFLCGILFCERSRIRVRHMLEKYSETDFHDLAQRLSRDGLRTRLNGRSVQEVALELIDLAAQGLPSCFPDGREATDHLIPIRRLAERGKTPADVVLERFSDAREWLAAGRVF